MHRLVAFVAVLFTVVFASCGSDNVASGPADFIPAGAPVFIEVSVAPGEQVDNAEALIERVGELPLLGSAVDPETLIQQALDAGAAGSGSNVSYAEDIEPWLGDRAGFGVTDFDPATGGAEAIVALDVSDPDIAKDSIERLASASGAELESVELGGVSGQRPPGEEGAFAFVDDFLVFGSSDDAFEVAVAESDSVADSDEYSDAFAGLPEDRLAAAYIDVGANTELAAAEDPSVAAQLEESRPLLGDLLEGSIGVALTAEADGLALTSSVPDYPFGRFYSTSDLLEQAPAESFAALGFDNLGEQAQGLVELLESSGEIPGGEIDAFEDAFGVTVEQVTAAFGDASLSVSGELPDFIAELEFAISDPEVAARVVEAIRAEAEGVPTNGVGPPLSGADEGFSVTDRAPNAKAGFGNIELEADRISIQIASSEGALAATPREGSLADNEVYQRSVEALGEDYEPVGFVDLAPILDAAVGDSSLFDAAIGTATSDEAIASFLANKLGFVALGENAGGDRLLQRFVFGLAE